MQTVFRRQIKDGVFLTCVRTQKFKTGVLSATMIAPLSKEAASKNALLPRVLRRGTALHPNMESLAAALDELYGARIEPVVRKKGEVQLAGFYADFVDDYFVPAGEQILEKTAALIGEMLLTPATSGGMLIGDYVDSERSNLIDEIKAAVNDKRQYAVTKLIELMCQGESYGVTRLGSESSAKKITAAGLTKHYREMIASCPIEVFYCGGADSERVERAVLYALAALPRAGKGEMPHTEVRLEPVKPEPRYFTEELDVTQGKLSIGFRLGEVMRTPDYASVMAMNSVFGGSVTSKLMENVREKLSLCYYASSMIEKHKGIMLVSSGIEFSKYEEALSEIMHQLDAVKSGDFTDDELQSAKRSVITGLKTVMDNPRRIEDYFIDAVFTEVRSTPEELAELVGKVTNKDVIKAASGIKTDAVYFLKGGGTAENEK
ncbi:MAG: M16 family metallopeptidase [Oscillospiraceae bacterium]